MIHKNWQELIKPTQLVVKPGADAARVATVEDLGFDTYSDEARFFSYRRATHRREPDYGRHIAAICLEG